MQRGILQVGRRFIKERLMMMRPHQRLHKISQPKRQPRIKPTSRKKRMIWRMKVQSMILLITRCPLKSLKLGWKRSRRRSQAKANRDLAVIGRETERERIRNRDPKTSNKKMSTGVRFHRRKPRIRLIRLTRMASREERKLRCRKTT